MTASKYIFITATLAIFLESSQAVKNNAQKTKLAQSLSLIKTKLATRYYDNDYYHGNYDQNNSVSQYTDSYYQYYSDDNSTNSTDSNIYEDDQYGNSNNDSESNSTNSTDNLPVSCPNGAYNLDYYDQEIFNSLVDDAWSVVLDYGLYTYDQEYKFREEAEDSLQEICYYYQFETFVNQTREALNFLRQGNYSLEQWTPSAEDLKQVDKLVAEYLVELLLVKEKEIRTLAESLTNSSKDGSEFNSSVSYLETQVKNKIAELNGDYSHLYSSYNSYSSGYGNNYYGSNNYGYSGNYYYAQTKNTIKRAQSKNFWDNVVTKE
ncbi:UNKNOWN [Stylonychia lemnae]|uniref:Uncharacterized protein n=1 Tax=Stylonychia lemnae TaxID=5949 RepID=A0A078AH43_STYLE|nr:UNKNOWN [Stylonychia lemnae]|eukprot:CDW81600.1 UNKNOWN [Stylonychia lemnae]